MNNNDASGAQNAGIAFQKAWLNSLSQAMQGAFPSSSPPLDLLRQLQESGFQAWTQAWSQCLNSPLFAAGLKQWMGGPADLGKDTSAPAAAERNEPSAFTRADCERILQTVRQMEEYLDEQANELSREVRELRRRVEALERKLSAAPLAHQPNRKPSPHGGRRPGKGRPGALRPA